MFLDFRHIVACDLAKKRLPEFDFTIKELGSLEPPKKRQRLAACVECVFKKAASNKLREHFDFLLDYLSEYVASSSASYLRFESSTEMELSKDMLSSPRPLRKRKRVSITASSSSEESDEESHKNVTSEKSDAVFASSYTLDAATAGLLRDELGLLVVDNHFSMNEQSPFHYELVELNQTPSFNKEAPIVFQTDYLRECKRLEGSEGEQQYAVSLGELFQHRNILKSAVYHTEKESIEGELIEGAVARQIVTFLSNVTPRSQAEIEPKKMYVLATQQSKQKEDTFKGQGSIMHTFWKVMIDILKADELLGIILSRLEKEITTPLSFSPAIYWAVKEFKEFGVDKHNDVLKAIIQASKQSMDTARQTGVCAPVLVQIAAGKFMKILRVERMPRQLYEFAALNDTALPAYSRDPLTEAIQAEMQRMLELAELEVQGKPEKDAFYRSAQRLQAYLAAYEMYFNGGLEYVTVISSLDDSPPFHMVDMTQLESESISKFIERFDAEILYLFNSWMEFFGVKYSIRQKLPTLSTGFASHPFRSYKLLPSTHPTVLITQWDTTKKAMVPTSVLKESENAAVEEIVQMALFKVIPEYMPELIRRKGKYLLMKYKGVDLATFLNENEALRKRENVFHTVQQVLSLLLKPLLKLHSAKVSHRDVKETNILVEVDSSGNIAQLNLCDFESARGKSTIGIEKFTAGYIAPELTKGFQRSPTLKEDIYSLGVTVCKIIWSDAIYKNSMIKKTFAEYEENHFERAIEENKSAFDFIIGAAVKGELEKLPEQLATLLREMTRVDHTKRYDAKQVEEYLTKNSWSTK